MISPLSFSFISFINYFMIPLISLRIYCKRHSLEWKCSMEFLYRYVLMCIINLPVGRVLAAIVEKITSTVVHGEATKYTIVALIGAVCIPYAMEIIEKFIHVDVEIHNKKKAKED